MVNNSLGGNQSIVEILNGTLYPDSGLTPNYTQGSPSTDCERIRLLTAGPNTTTTPLSGDGSPNAANFTLTNTHLECYPGRYYTSKFTIRNFSSNETANITIYLDIPISITNTLSNITAKGSFSGAIPVNTSVYHSFYFNTTSSNTSEIINATAIVINLTSLADVDMFLFDDSGVLRAKSINKTANSEWLDYSFLPTSSSMWEIRIFGNSTSSAITYSGTIFFITMSITDSAGNTPSIINFGTLNATTNTNTSIFLKNEGNYTLTDVAETKELYHVTRFSGSGTSNYTFLVPDSSIVSKVKVSLNWTGASNYSFKFFNQDGTLMASSSNKYVYANRTKAMQEEYAETASIGSSNKYWRVEVVDNALVNSLYTLNAYLYVYNVSEWIITNYTTMTFNRTNANVTLITFNASSSAMNGTYEGLIRYRDGNGIGISIPIRAYVVTPMLLVNDTLNTEVFRLDENYGTNLTRIIYFNISNIGNNEMILNFTDSGSLSCYSGSCSGYSANFSYNTTHSIAGNSNSLVNVNITFNSSLPVNTVYTGWIRINSTNVTSNITSHPYSDFLITLRLNLTNALDVRPDFATSDGSRTIKNASSSENVTVKVNVYYINGTGPITDLLLGNFTSVWLQERNVTSTLGRIPSSGTLNISAGKPTLYSNGYYNINVTVPANSLGGLYDVHATATASRESGSFSGNGVSNSLVINNTGLYMSTTNSTSFTIGNTSISMFAVNVSNYGNLSASSATINLTESCSGYSVAYIGMTGSCFGSGSGVTAIISPLGYNTSCVIWWNITAIATADACVAYVMGSPLNQWFNPNYINVTVTISGGSGSSSSSSSSSSSNTALNATTYTPNLAFTKVDAVISVQQNSSASTEVGISNTGQTNQNITFSIGTINSSWYSLNATNLYLVAGRSGGIRVTFTVGNVEVKDYNGVFKATSPTKEITSNFILRVTPAPTTKAQINETLQAYRTNMTSLGQQLNQLKSQGYNVTDVQAKFNELESKVEQAESYIRSGDYNSAYYLFDDIKSLLSEVKSDLTKVKKTGAFGFISLPQGITLYILIGVGIAVGGVLVYLFWPTRGLAKPAYGAKTEEVKKPKPTGPSKLEQIKGFKEKLSKIFKREKSKPKYLLNESS
jgi:hypothetical protein